MKIAYQSTIDEAVQDLIRSLDLEGDTKRYLRNRITFIVVAAVAAFILLPTDNVQGAYLAILTGGFYLACAYALRRARRLRDCRKYLIGLFGSDGPIDAECEASERGVMFRQGGQESRVEWNSVVAVKEKGDVIEVIAEPPGLVRIPGRIFRSLEERDAWLSYMRSRVR